LGTTALVPRPFSHRLSGALSFGLVAEKLPGHLGATDEARGRWTIVRLAAAQENGKKTAFSSRTELKCDSYRIWLHSVIGAVINRHNEMISAIEVDADVRLTRIRLSKRTLCSRRR
jgi:hypothetical protein